MKFAELEGKVPSRSLAAIWPPTRAARAGCRNETPTPRRIRPGVPCRELAGKLARLETEVGVSLEEKEGKERELAGMLERFQSEIDQLNEKKRELEVGIFPAFFRSKVCGRCVRSFPAKTFPSKRNARNWT